MSAVSNPFDTPQGAVRVALQGFAAARERVADIAAAARPEHRFIAVTEALWWARAIDENFGKVGKPNAAGESYAAAAIADIDGRVLPGVRYARNRGGHQLTLVTRLVRPLDPKTLSGAAFRRGVRPPASFTVPAWRPFADLPPPDPRHPDTPGQQAYKHHLDGRTVGNTLEQLSRWFAKAEREHL